MIATVAPITLVPWPNQQLNSTYFKLFLILEGPTEKLSKFTMPLNSIYNKKIVIMNKNVFLKMARK
jgi:hypothetical protein